MAKFSPPAGCHTAGNCGTLTATAELYDPRTGQWSPTGARVRSPPPSSSPAVCWRETCLSSAVAAAGSFRNVLASAELYDPSSGDWRTTGATLTARSDHQQQLLADGMVLAFGGYPGLATAELYNPATARWTPTASMNLGRESAGSVLFGDGRFLIAGGFAFNPTATAEIYTP